MWGGSLIPLCGEQWQLQQLPLTLVPDLQLQLESFWTLDLISAAVVTVLDVWSGREEALPWETAAQVLCTSSKTAWGCYSVISLLYMGGSCLIWVTSVFIVVRILLQVAFCPYTVCAVSAFKSGCEFYDLQSARNMNNATNIKEIYGTCSLLSNQRYDYSSRELNSKD